MGHQHKNVHQRRLRRRYTSWQRRSWIDRLKSWQMERINGANLWGFWLFQQLENQLARHHWYISRTCTLNQVATMSTSLWFQVKLVRTGCPPTTKVLTVLITQTVDYSVYFTISRVRQVHWHLLIIQVGVPSVTQMSSDNRVDFLWMVRSLFVTHEDVNFVVFANGRILQGFMAPPLGALQ